MIESSSCMKPAGPFIKDKKMNKFGYSKYIKEHIENVQKVWEDIQPFLKDEYQIDDSSFRIISEIIKIHDVSKYNLYEFNGYCQWFYNTETEKRNVDNYNCALNHHYNSNPHHWQYWLLWSGKEINPLPMPFDFIIEMLCDWAAMAYKLNEDSLKFYVDNKESMKLHNDTIQLIEKWIEPFNNLLSEKSKL